MSSLLAFNRLEIQTVNSHVGFFYPSNLLTGSPPPLPCMNNYSEVLFYTMCNREGGGRVVWRAYTGVIHCGFDQTKSRRGGGPQADKHLPSG
jgi:hypothetical protein